MKITKPHYEMIKLQMKDGITFLSSKNGITPLEWFENVERAYVSYTKTRKLWDVYWGTGGNDWMYIAFSDGDIDSKKSRWGYSLIDWKAVKFWFNCVERNSAKYNDDHLKTAISKAYSELKLWPATPTKN